MLVRSPVAQGKGCANAVSKSPHKMCKQSVICKHCVSLSEKLTGVPVKKIGGDQGYSGNDNRTFCKENGIETSFTQKGRTGKNEVKNATKRELASVRATAMEGSFGTQKEH